ncbi:MAG: phosphoenolpyruvate--protein phosphotransferase, partial [Candidatus Accumulibacter sp.]|nr:phosphoenolpyruvate--protein phosphotransferase [Accumulibacter sp.]
VQQMEVLVGQFESFDDQYLRERSYDVRQVVERVIKELVGQPGRTAMRIGKGVKEEDLIVVAHDLSPADVISYKDHRFAAFVTDVGGSTSHTAILARSLRIPAVLGLHNARQLIRDKEVLIVDGTRGVLIVNPDPRVLDEYRLRKSQIELERSKLKRLKTAKSSTLDGVDIALHANIELPGDVANALDGGAEGIGLFRTEFLFLDRGDMPTEDEQFEAYRTVVKGMAGRPVTIRTFDLGYDKDLHPEKVVGDRLQSNPALGLRAIRLSLREPQLLETQLAAILRAAALGPLRVLLPMISAPAEMVEVRRTLQRVYRRLKRRKVALPETLPPLGCMIEVPGAA